MFTGIVAAVAPVRTRRNHEGGARLALDAPRSFDNLLGGESISVSGVCLTLLPGGRAENLLAFDVSPETLLRSTLGELEKGDAVNLERALAAGERFGGHIVSGHVDATTLFLSRTDLGGFLTYTFELGAGFARYVVEKGSIAVDGVSLTISRLGEAEFDVALIPHTLSGTTLGGLRPGARVNVEVDLIGKYVERMLGERVVERASIRE